MSKLDFTSRQVFNRAAARRKLGIVAGPSTTDDLAEGLSNLYFTNARARSALSATAPVAYNSSTGVISMAAATASVNGYLSSADFTTFAAKESVLTFSAPLSRSTNTISIPVATTSVNGYLSSTDWTTFNSKVGTARSISTTAPLAGGGDLSADRTLSIPKSTASVDGYLAAADFTTFNAKVSTSRLINTTSPITGGGDLSADRTIAFSNQSANQVLAGPTTGSAAAPAFRALVAADIPSLSATYLPLSGGTLTGNLLFTDNTLDIGASGATRPRTGYFGTSLFSPLFQATTGGSQSAPVYSFTGSTNSGFYNTTGNTLAMSCGGTRRYTFDGTFVQINNSVGYLDINGDVQLKREAAATWKLGLDSSAPIAQTIKSCDARAGTDTNTAGANLTIAAGRNTGTGIGGSLLFQTSPSTGSSGTGAGTLATRLQITGDAKIGFYGVTPVARSAAYTFTNQTALRTIDVSTATLTNALNCLAAIVADLQSVGLFA